MEGNFSWAAFAVEILPLIILCVGALACLMVDVFWPKQLSELVYGLGVITIVVAFMATWQMWGNHLLGEGTVKPALLHFDQLTLSVVFIALAAGLITLLNALGYVRLHQNLAGEFCVLVLFSLIGLMVWVGSDHLLINFIGLETLSLAVYVLAGSQKKSAASAEAAAKYFIMGGVASAIMLFGIALFYGGYATFSISVISVKSTSIEALRDAGLALLLVGVFFKLAVVPFHFWAPDVYEGAPAPVTGFMATAVKIAAFGFAMRLFSEFKLFDVQKIQLLVTVLVVLSLVVANAAAIMQENLKRMLAYSSIAHAGFMLLGVAAGMKNGSYDAATSHTIVFYLLAYTFTTLGAFAILSLMMREHGDTALISDLRGLGVKHPLLAFVFMLFLLSLTGIPPTAGFAAKYGIISMALQNGHTALALLGVATSVVSAFYYLRPLMVMYFGADVNREIFPEVPLTVLVSLVFCAVAVVVLGLMPDAFIAFSKLAVMK